MCGIAGVFIRDPGVVKSHEALENFVDELFLGNESRGRRASGFVAVSSDGKVVIDKAPVTASEFIKTRDRLPKDTKMVLVHTRLDTQGTPEDHRNNHPVIHKSCFTVHNGWVRNDDELYEKYGYERHGEVDSEIIAAMLYEADFDIDKMKDAFKEMEGGIACANIDPVRHPGKVVLARTINSPLYILDRDTFVVWASEDSTIRDAWGNVLGTPPDKKKFKSAGMRELFVVSDEGIDKHDIPFKGWSGSNYPTYQGYTTIGGVTRSGTTPSQMSTSKGTVSSSSIPDTTIKVAVEARRAMGHSTEARIMTDDHDAKTKIGPWIVCEVCNEGIYHADIRASIKGKICKDCYSVWMEFAAARREAMNKPWSVIDGTAALVEEDFDSINAKFSTEVRNSVSTWAEDEAYAHQNALEELSSFTGFTKRALDYLLFRISPAQTETVDGLARWRDDLLELYDYEYGLSWETLGGGTESYGLDALRVATQKPKLIVVGQKPDQLALPAGPVVPTFKVLFSDVQPKPNKDECHFCTSHAQTTIERMETDERIPYCGAHYYNCWYKECTKEANHTTYEGIRLCHNHARSVPSCFADTVLEQQEYSVGVEVLSGD